MRQIGAVVNKTLKEFIRNKMELTWTFLVPILFLIIIPFMYGDLPAALLVQYKGALTITMASFLIAFVCQSSLAGSISSDRAKGLYLKMSSMPVNPWREGIGRILALWIFSIIGLAIILSIGLLYGAQFSINAVTLLAIVGIFLIILLMTSGTGLIIAALIQSESAATHTGVALTLLTYFLGGMAFPYANLPSFMQVFARIHPLSSGNAMIVCLLEGEEIAGYNPLTFQQLGVSIAIALATFLVGFLLYSKYCWKKR